MDHRDDFTPDGWVESLERGKAQVEAGDVVPMEPFLERLRASIARMEAGLHKRPQRSTRKT